MKATQNVNIAEADYKKRRVFPPFLSCKNQFVALIYEIAKLSPLPKGKIANKNRWAALLRKMNIILQDA